MGPIKFNLSVASAATTAGLMVCLLTTATLVTVGHAAIATAADGSDAGPATPNAAIVNRKVTADGGDGGNSGHRDDEELPAMSKPSAAAVVVEEREPSASAAESCREACSKKHSTKESLCSQRRNCSTCQRKCILESLSPSSRDSAHRLTLVLLQMIRNESLVTADVAWVNAADSRSSANRSQQQQQNQQQPQQCLVTWEVSGGGLMGNLLTESSTVQLSLWPETNYRVQVTCRSKHTNAMIRSAPIVLNTAAATAVGSGQGKRPTTEVANGGEAPANLEELVPVSRPEDSAPIYGQEDLRVTCHNEESGGHPNGLREVLLLGVYITLLVFLMILLTLISFIQPKPKPAGLDKESSSCSDTSSIASDKQVLVKNDVMAADTTSLAGTEILHV